MGLQFQFKTFHELSTSEFHDIIALRIKVFVVEQNCPYLELDGKDKKCYHVICRTSMVTVESPRITVQPRRVRRSAMMSTSAISGTLRMVLLPTAKRDAAINFRTEFLAPVTVTSPTRRQPPVIRKRSRDEDAISEYYL